MSEHDLGGFAPFNEAHAIVSAQATIQFAGSVSDAQWSVLRPVIFKLGRELDIGQPSPSFGLNVTFDGSRLGVAFNAPSVNAQQMAGLAFSIYDQEDRLVERFSANKDAIQIQSNSYIRWRPFAAKFEKFARSLYKYHNYELPFALVQLEYWDRFDAVDPESADVSKIIRSDAPWIAPAGPVNKEPWHNHTGYFQRLSPKVRRLSSARVDYGDFPGKRGTTRSIIVYTSAQDAINAPSYEKTIGMGWGLPEVMAALERQHASLKEDLQRIITPEAAERIGL